MSIFINNIVPAKKGWKKFTKTLKSNTHKLNKTTTFHLLSVCHKTKTLHFFNRHHRNLKDKNSKSSAIYVDKLFPDTKKNVLDTNSKRKDINNINVACSSIGGSAKGEEMTMMDINKLKKQSVLEFDVDEAWKKVFDVRELRGVDERAEEFIMKVRHDMKIQREQSILDYQEMLARGL